MKRLLLLLVAALCATGCGGTKTGDRIQVEALEDGEEINPFAMIDLSEDHRALNPKMAALASGAESEVRRRIGMAAGRIGSLDGVPILLALVDDSEPEVRIAAAFATGLFGEKAPKKLLGAISAQLSKETNEEVLVELIGTLGRIAPVEDAKTLAKPKAVSSAAVRAAHMRALGIMGQRGFTISDDVVTTIAKSLVDPSEPVRFMAAFALFRIADPLPGPPTATKALARAALEDDSAEVRAYALKALARRGGLDESILAKALDDTGLLVGATAVSVLPLVGDENRCKLASSALEKIAALTEKSPKDLHGNFAHTARAALEVAGNCPQTDQITAAASQIDAATKNPQTLEPAGLSRVRCLARLVSQADELKLLSCAPRSHNFGKQMLIDRLEQGADTTDRALASLTEMIADSDPKVATLAIGAIGAIGRPESDELLIKTLADDRALIVAAALDAFAMATGRFAEEKKRASLLQAVGGVLERFGSFDNIYSPTISSIQVLEALGDPGAEPMLRLLAGDQRPPIRNAVLKAYASIDGIEPPVGRPSLLPTRPYRPDKLENWRGKRHRALVRTTRGTLSILLKSDVAPATVASFVELSQSGYFEDTEVHRVVPNFVVQAGDPTGTGLGDPGYALRCELSPLPYERGTVGMALSGKDTGGSQFFIGLSRQPHLTGNYTVFGEVESGMETVDLIEEGDRIIEITISKIN
jgi:cyclophilin family peptidyl-prolyl cis-trans isomerase/HEAT repeat protein